MKYLHQILTITVLFSGMLIAAQQLPATEYNYLNVQLAPLEDLQKTSNSVVGPWAFENDGMLDRNKILNSKNLNMSFLYVESGINNKGRSFIQPNSNTPLFDRDLQQLEPSETYLYNSAFQSGTNFAYMHNGYKRIPPLMKGL
ncbi:MAG: hypothetical protein WBA16_10660 [Nonlabens sp.]